MRMEGGRKMPKPCARRLYQSFPLRRCALVDAHLMVWPKFPAVFVPKKGISLEFPLGGSGWLKDILCGHTGVAFENGRKTGLPKTEIAKGFWPPLETDLNEASGGPLRPGFDAGPADHSLADSCDAGIRHPPGLDDCFASQGKRKTSANALD